jgi:hypothetical protein
MAAACSTRLLIQPGANLLRQRIVREGGAAVGESGNELFQPSFNSSLKVDFQGSRMTTDGGLILVRQLRASGFRRTD